MAGCRTGTLSDSMIEVPVVDQEECQLSLSQKTLQCWKHKCLHIFEGLVDKEMVSALKTVQRRMPE